MCWFDLHQRNAIEDGPLEILLHQRPNVRASPEFMATGKFRAQTFPCSRSWENGGIGSPYRPS
jgi:hypothetical protein